MSKKILILNWKDIKHPQAGGAEVVTHEIAKRLVKEGNKVTILTAKYGDSSETDNIDGIDIIRAGKGKLFHYSAARNYYRKNLKNKFDIIIEEVNTIPYFINISKGNEKVFLFYHQLARKVWFHEMFFPLSLVGYLVEPIYTFFQSRFNCQVITVSQSSKDDLLRFGFSEKNVHIISEGIENTPIKSLKQSKPKEKNFTVLFHSSLRAMKRPIEVFRAFSILVKEKPNSQLWISGGGDQSELKTFAEENNFAENVVFYGRTSDNQKFDLMQKSHVICSTSIKEGWGLVITEANSQGTPAISYDVDGLRDSTRFSGGGVVEPNPQAMAKSLLTLENLVSTNSKEYQILREKALESSKKINFSQSYKDFNKIINK